MALTDGASSQATLLEAGELDLDNVDLLVQVAEPASFRAAHVPGAVLVEPRDLVCGIPPATGRLPPHAQLSALFSRIGYRRNMEIVACDDEGGGWAGRFLWTLDVIGHRNWGYLNGGIHAWIASGRSVETGVSRVPVPSKAAIKIDLAPIAEAEDVLDAIEDANQVIWDVRSAEEFGGIRRVARRAGHVPGAVNIDWLALKDPFDRQRLIPDIRQLLDGHGICPDKSIITHCQTHHRSGLSYLVARLLEYPDVRAYHGSWSEWGNRDDLPVEVDG